MDKDKAKNATSSLFPDYENSYPDSLTEEKKMIFSAVDAVFSNESKNKELSVQPNRRKRNKNN